MAIKNSFAAYINGINYSHYAVMPLKMGNFLDERLDECTLTLKCIRKKNFPSLTPVEIEFSNRLYWTENDAGEELIKKQSNKVKYYLVANDTAVENPVGSGRYDHEIYLLELTKYAERLVVDTITFTNDLGRNYASNPQKVKPENENWQGADVFKGVPDSYVSPLKSGITFEFVPYSDVFGALRDERGFELYFNENLIYSTRNFNTGYTTTLFTGTYRVVYILFNVDGSKRELVTFTFLVVENKLPLKKWTIKDVINRTLDIAEPIRKGEKSRFKLNAEQAELFDKILAPEFSFTKQTLRECLQEVGRFVHGEPRLTVKKDADGYYYEVLYDMFTAGEKAFIATRKYLRRTTTHAIESFATSLDSNAENLVNTLDKFSGVITEPYAGGYKMVRAETSYVRITESNMLIATQYPIYSIEKLEWQDQSGGSVDITLYLFESSIYNTQLSSYDNQYPYSKAYGLRYTQGSKNIDALNFKESSATFPEFQEYAITNILRRATGNASLTLNYPTLAFRVTYTPIYSGRVSQTKPYYKDMPRSAALIYNQQSNMIESRYYGENLKGAISRIGNIDITITYLLTRFHYIPKAGMMFDDDYYISAVAVEFLPTIIKCTIGLSKDFNRLSQYIGIDSSKRFSEISQTQASERNRLYREYVVIGDEEEQDNDSFIGNAMMGAIADTFTQTGNFRPLTCVAAWGSTYKEYSTDVKNEVTGQIIENGVALLLSLPNTQGQRVTVSGVTLQEENGLKYSLPFQGETQERMLRIPRAGRGTILSYGLESAFMYQSNLPPANLSVVSSAFGNSISFSWLYEDNYSAGSISVDTKNGNISGYFQNSYRYTDYYGKIYYYDFDLQEKGTGSTPLSFPRRESVVTTSSGYISTVGLQPYILRKDNREALQVNVQIDFVTNLKDLIIGSALSSYCSAVRGSDSTLAAKLYIFPDRLDKFIDHVQGYLNIDLNTLPSMNISVRLMTGQFVIESGKFPSNGKAWAIVTNQTKGNPVPVEDEEGNITDEIEIKGGDVLIARNIEISAGQQFTPIYFTRKREIFDKSVWIDRK